MKTTTVLGLSVVSIGIAGTVMYLRWKKSKITTEPGTWHCVGHVTKLFLYPMKSTRYKCLEEADTTDMGLMEVRQDDFLKLRDRIFVVFKEDTGEFITARTYKNLLKITVESIKNDAVQMSYDEDKIIITIPSEYKGDKVTLWREEKIPMSDCGDEAAMWISQHILEKDSGLRIGYWSEMIQERRKIEKTHVQFLQYYKRMKTTYTGAYSDLAAYELMNESSVADLNSRLNDKEVTELNFRPNIVISGPKAYEEDHWDWVKIGENAIFSIFKSNARCTLTTVNPETLERDKNFEPLSTLKKYRLSDNKHEHEMEKSPRLGMYMGLHKCGRIKIGDPIYVSS